MPPAPLSVSPKLDARLQALATATGRSREACARLALEAGVEELEDTLEADAVIAGIRSGEIETLPSREFWDGVDG